MKLNNIDEGDIFFTTSYTFLGLCIKIFTGFKNPTHVGKIIKNKKGEIYTLEMVGDFKDDNDLESRPLSYYTNPWRFWTRIVAIKRAPEMVLVENKIKFSKLDELIMLWRNLFSEHLGQITLLIIY